jgi:hypothetical protein
VFSRRLPSLGENRVAAAVDAARAAGRSLVDLTETNPTRVGIAVAPSVAEAIRAALGAPAVLAYDPTPLGLPPARRAIAERYYRARHGAEVEPDALLLTASTSEGYAMLWKLLCDPGDRVLVPQPSYPLFELLGRLEGIDTATYCSHFDGDTWHLDVDDVAAQLDASGGRARAIVVVSPNNPTGAYLKRHEREALVALAAAREVALVVDEVFLDYPNGDDPARAGTMVGEGRALTFVLSGLSKPCGLPQLKLGWIATSGPPALVGEARARLELIADTALSVGAPVQHAAPLLIDRVGDLGAAIAARVADNRRALAAACAARPDAGVTPLRAEGGWAAILRVPRLLSDEEWTLRALDAGVLVHPGFFYDIQEGHLVVSLLPEPAAFLRGVGALLDVGRALLAPSPPDRGA